ncbi:hypothetical protein NC653_021842 [Populus alba x Populus x berolinensis]|uniref:Uncharacterized protein n=1 Tax=Populus alba x Populus x berolinensis TaxID=444605 RepID=A0AAD6QED8_9ROSI|nr:hypothetical protein NC653_021842 [Populus alba x Populus x berolinensis]
MSNLPWLLVGDFKVVRSFEESASDSDYSRAGMEAFDTFGNAQFLHPGVSDHAPSLVKTRCS